ncbi:MAG: flippase [Thermodesulfobacteriota bacterium]
MRRVISNTIRRGLKSTICANIISLYVLQISFYVLPLITVPYLVRVLGAEKFGLVSFGQSLINFFVFFINYGFDLTATREISIKRDDNRAVSRLSSSVWLAKFLLSLAGFLVLLAMIAAVRKMNQIAPLLLILYGLVVGNMLFPSWLFLGLERMKAISAINLIMRSVATAGVFIFVRNPDDYLVYAGLLSFQWVFAGLAGVLFAVRRLRIRIRMPGAGEVLSVLSGGLTLFVSNIAQSLYIGGNSFILGLLTNYSAVGYYSAAEKITLSLMGMFRPLAQAVYPRFSQLASSSRETVLLWGKRLVYAVGGLGIITSFALFFGAPLIVKIVLGKGFDPSIAVLQIMAVLPILMALSDVLGIQIMLPFGKDRLYAVIRILTASIHLLLAILIVPRFKEAGMAFVFVMSQVFILALTFSCLRHWGLTPFHHKVSGSAPQSTVKSG